MRRPLTQLERMICSIENVYQSTGTITVRILGTFSVERLQAALVRVQKRHPELCVRVEGLRGLGGSFVTDGVPDFPLTVLENAAEDRWQTVSIEEIARPFSFQIGPLVRFVLIRCAHHSDLVIVSNHLIADGVTGIGFLLELLWQLGDPNSAPPPPAQFPPLEDLLPAAPKQLPRRKPASHSRRGLQPSAQAGPHGILFFALDAKESAALCQRSRQESTTIQAAISTAFLRACARLDPSSSMRRVETPVNLRGRIAQLGPAAFGNYMSLLQTAVDCDLKHGFWNVARTYRQKLSEQIDSFEPFEMWWQIKRFAARIPNPILGWLTRLNLRMRSQFTYDLSITNLGRLPILTEYGDLRIANIFPPSLGPAQVGQRLLSVLMFEERICMTLTHCDVRMAEKLKELGLSELRSALA